MMKINILNIKKQLGAKQPFRFATTSKDLDIEPAVINIAGIIEIKGEVENIGSLLQVSGSVSAVVNRVCNRCLRKFSVQANIPFAENFQSAVEVKHDENDDGFYYDDDDEIIIDDLIRELLLLAEPMKPVCSDECKGLCPVCGADLNTVCCSCAKEHFDPRLSVLQKLLTKK